MNDHVSRKRLLRDQIAVRSFLKFSIRDGIGQ